MTAAELRAARKAVGLTQTELGRRVGWKDGNRVNALESGRQTLTHAAARKLQAALDGSIRPEVYKMANVVRQVCLDAGMSPLDVAEVIIGRR